MKLITNVPLAICARDWAEDWFDSVGITTTPFSGSYIMLPQTICKDELELLELMDDLEYATCKRFQISSCHVFADSAGVCLAFNGIRTSRDEKRDFYKSLGG